MLTFFKNSRLLSGFLRLPAFLRDGVPRAGLKKKSVYVRITGSLRKRGLLRTIVRSLEEIPLVNNVIRNDYQRWIKKNESDEKTLKPQIEEAEAFSYRPLISIIVPVFNTPRKFLVTMIQSVIEQTYSNWELCVADGNSKGYYVRELLESYSSEDNRIKVIFLDRNKGIAGNSNAALSQATGDFVALLDHDDLLPVNALFEIVKRINEIPETDFIYTDEDMISEDAKKRFNPHFKPDWSPDTLRSYNYITHLSVFKKELIGEIGGLREGFDGSQDYDLILRASEKAKRIEHVPKVLYHWRVSANSVAGNTNAKPYAYEAAKKALKEHLARVGLRGDMQDGYYLGFYRVQGRIERSPLVSIVIPTRDNVEMLKTCMESVMRLTTYPSYEIVLIDNGSESPETFRYYDTLREAGRVRLLKYSEPFNYAAINNYAVKEAKGDYLLFLNNDTEVISTDWIEQMLMYSLRKDVGAVGAKLYYPDGSIQHAGLILGIGGVAGHSHKCFSRESVGYFNRLTIVQNLSAVTAACMMVRRDVFDEAGGFDESFSHAFNDVDLCMKVREKGYLVVFTPYAELYHHESKTRGYEDTAEKQERFKREIELFRQKWGHILEQGDPYYNPNLTLDKEDFSIKL